MYETEIQRSAGGVVLHRGQLLLIEARRTGRWQLPKGHLEPGESAQEAAVREVREETGAAVEVVAPAGSVDYHFRDQQGRWIDKHVDFYLCAFSRQVTDRCDPREVRRACWHRWERALELLAFENERALVRASLDRLTTADPDGLLEAGVGGDPPDCATAATLDIDSGGDGDGPEEIS